MGMLEGHEKAVLAIVGKDGFGAKEIRQKAKSLESEGVVKFFGYVPDAEHNRRI